ncbi:glycosyltransferase [Mycobacterium phage Tesla]|uniref:Glycosyltransferase n=9 Tax=Marvinvirus TaxID=1982091 RepID=A0A3S9U955_9CAUD|nr:glucosyltransferase [Mycobacterium phage MosMoris]ANM46308.1 glycosyltransferase [Mycobacterium phage Gattaca]AVE00830.1 glycosyltransferase [Mycobacterium phage Tesla]AYB70718.1 glycosyltransferase [Mycobacterium phage VasuNzinga]AZS06854.1 glycosyltransferase [Mycobacterium phage Raela]QAX93139.1 glycosyltransferase [Mycobacterium phage RedRaider77]QBQ71379.1 glycosyltransferase [Mycobacterium phage Blackbeetle]QFP94225.1 glycosyltransferase [Mycobacterium phage JoieB]QFP94415.1 glycos
MVEYAIGVVSHIDRTAMAADLSRRARPRFVSPDNGTLGAYGNHELVQRWLANEAGWSVVLEDDALPLHDFHHDLEQALEMASHHESVKVVSLYLGTGYPANWQRQATAAAATDASLILCNRLLHAVGYCVAPEIKSELSYWLGARSHGRPIDLECAMTTWLQAHDYLVAYTNPSLVDHRDTTPVLKHRPGTFSASRKLPRRAHNTNQRLTWDDNAVIMFR